MKRVGFTLIEMIAVIIIIAILSLVTLPTIINQYLSKKEDISKTTEQLILDAAELYASEKNLNYGTITLEDLVKDEKLEAPITDYKTGKEIALNTVIYFDQNGSACIAGREGCQKVNAICKRATTLHKETCGSSNSNLGCGADGYIIGDTITYGSRGTKGKLKSGDAFDCDVNGDGTYDSKKERFYYVSGLNGNNSSDIAVLVYSNSVSGGEINNQKAFNYYEYGSVSGNWFGPVTAIKQLPTTSQWSNVSLTNTTRSIQNESGGTTTTGGSLPTNFSYSGYAARLLTVQEVNQACQIITKKTNSLKNKCTYLMENTSYSSNFSQPFGYWLETPYSSDSTSAFYIDTTQVHVNNYSGYQGGNWGIRPAIEVNKAYIDYK